MASEYTSRIAEMIKNAIELLEAASKETSSKTDRAMDVWKAVEAAEFAAFLMSITYGLSDYYTQNRIPDARSSEEECITQAISLLNDALEKHKHGPRESYSAVRSCVSHLRKLFR